MSLEETEDPLQEWRDALENNTAVTYLNTVDIGPLSREEAVTLMNELILEMLVMEVDREDIIDAILDIFQSTRGLFTDMVPFYSYMVGDIYVNYTAVSYVWMIKNVALMDILTDLTNWLQGGLSGLVLRMTVNIFTRSDKNRPFDILENPSNGEDLSDLLSNTSIAALMDLCEANANIAMWNWLRPQYAVDAIIVAPGPWMIKDRTGHHIALPIPWIDVDPTALIEELRETIDATIQTTSRTEDVAAVMEAGFRIGTSRIKYDIYGYYDSRYQNLVNKRKLDIAPYALEEELIRLYGPSNPFFGELSGDVDTGQDRMLKCTYWDYDEEIDDIRPWYRGVCDWRGHRITSERCALRIPVPNGGWMGCYCSAQCVRDKIEDMNDGTNLQFSPSTITAMLSMVDIMMEQVMQYGIYLESPTKGQPMRKREL